MLQLWIWPLSSFNFSPPITLTNAWLDNTVLCLFLQPLIIIYLSLKKKKLNLRYSTHLKSLPVATSTSHKTVFLSVFSASAPTSFHFSQSLNPFAQYYNHIFAYTRKFLGHLSLSCTLLENKTLFISKLSWLHTWMWMGWRFFQYLLYMEDIEC